MTSELLVRGDYPPDCRRASTIVSNAALDAGSRSVEDRLQAVSALVARIAGLEPDPTEVRVVLETRRGRPGPVLCSRGIPAGWSPGGKARLRSSASVLLGRGPPHVMNRDRLM
jgi:hypothetical protein